ncbi:type II secretion system F family protein [Helcococcus ovis]|uniref:type II secretion system F family protein n=1 Tax=Helcococcus ovis TaxID=72026 RepID=UPI0038B9D824
MNLFNLIIMFFMGLSLYFIIVALFNGKDSKKAFLKKRLAKISNLNNKADASKNKKSILSFILVSNDFKKDLRASGIKLKAEEYVAIWVAFTVLPILLHSLLNGFSVISVIFGILGFFVVPFWTKISKKKRKQAFNNQLNDALMIIANSLRSGFTFRHAIARVSEDLPDPIGEELKRVIREVNYGVNLEKSLRELAEKMESRELDMVTSAVSIQQRSGGNLAEILDKVSKTISDRINMKKKIRALTAQGRVGGIVIAMIPPFIALALSFINPQYLSPFFNTAGGIAILIFSVIWEILGFIVINKMVDIEY